MALLNKYIYLIIIVLYPFITPGQSQNFIADSLRTIELNKNAREFFDKGQFPQALDVFNELLMLGKKKYGDNNYNLGLIYLRIGATYRNLGQLDLALQNYKLAEINFLLAENYPFRQMISLYINIGIVYRSKLDYNKALQYFEQALSISLNETKASPEALARINYNVAESYYLTNNYEKATDIIHKNINVAYLEDKILYHELLANMFQVKGDTVKSKNNYQKVIDLTIALDETNFNNIATTYLNYSFFLISSNQFSEATETLKKAYNLIQLSKPVNAMVLSDYYEMEGRFASNNPVATKNLESFKKQKKQNLHDAIEWYKKGLLALKFPKYYSLETVKESKNWLSLMNCIDLLKNIGDNYNELANLEQTKENLIFTESMAQAINNYQIVGSLIQRARREISDDESKILLTTLEYSTFYEIIQISYTAYSITKDSKYLDLAFQNAERIKSSSVFEKISDQLALENSLVPDSLLNAEKKLNNTISVFSEKLYTENSRPNPDSILINEYNNEIFTATRKREELNRYMESEYKDFYDLKYSNSMLSIKDIQQKLKKDQVIIEYVLNETDTVTELYSFIISTENIDFYKQKVNSEFLNSIETVFYFMSNTEYMFTKNEDSKQFCLSSNQLYKYLILPYKNQIQNKKISFYIPFWIIIYLLMLCWKICRILLKPLNSIN